MADDDFAIDPIAWRGRGVGYDFDIQRGTLARLRNLHPQLNRLDGTMRIVVESDPMVLQARD